VIEQVANIMQQISNTTKKTDKEKIIFENKDNKLFLDVLNFIYNPYIKTNIAKKKLAKKINGDKYKPRPLSGFDDFMKYLSSSTGTDENIVTVQHFIDSQPENVRWLLKAIATKDLKIGVTRLTINKALGYDFIPSFIPMLADKYVDIKKSNGQEKIIENWRNFIGKKVIVTKKLDGNRALVFVRTDGDVDIYSREGHCLCGFDELEAAFKMFPKGFIYDGEMLATNEEGLNSKELFKKTSSIIKKKGLKTGIEFHVFDIIPIHAFEHGGWDVPCEKRKESLEKVIKRINHPLVKYVEPLYIGEFNKEIIERLSLEAKRNEEEGVMIQLAEAPYECKRTKTILKCKVFQSADVRCVDIYEGKSGKNVGRLGGLIVDYKGHHVRIGGGFSDEERTLFWENPNLVIGKIIEITFFEEFEDENGNIDLRFAQYKTIRHDKTEPSYY